MTSLGKLGWVILGKRTIRAIFSYLVFVSL